MSVNQFKRIIQATEAYYQPEDRMELLGNPTIVVIRIDSVMCDYPEAKSIIKLSNNGIEIELKFYKLDKNYRQDQFRDETGIGGWFRVCKTPILNVDEWVKEFENFFISITNSTEVIDPEDWSIRDNYLPEIMKLFKIADQYDIIIISGPDKIGKTTLAKQIYERLNPYDDDDDDIVITAKKDNTIELLIESSIDIDVVDIEFLNSLTSRVIITTTLDDIFEGKKHLLTKKLLSIKLTDIPYILHPILAHKEVVI